MKKWILLITTLTVLVILVFKNTNSFFEKRHMTTQRLYTDSHLKDNTIKGSINRKTIRKLNVLILSTFPSVSGNRWSARGILNGQCDFIDNRIEYYNKSDVVIFKQNQFKQRLPTYRPDGQLWVYYAWESATNAMKQRFKGHMDTANYFNYTMTYSTHSNISHPYGECKKLSQTSANIDQVINKTVAKKTHLVAWLVSHCMTSSLRENYVRELVQHIHVDVLGGCGSIQCDDKEHCYEILSKYKFYLAFENSLCGEYMTEKLWRSYTLGLVPVVYGGLDAYKAILPVNSYIDVTDFSSPRMLADYLLQVHNNDTLYRSYFSWKHKYSCGSTSKIVKLETICYFLLTANRQTIDLNRVWDYVSNKCEDTKQYISKLGITDLKARPFSKKDLPEH